MPTTPRPLKVFLCHAPSDENIVRELYSRLTQDGVDAWLNSEKLLPGQDRELEIRKAVDESDTVVVCLSKRFDQAGPQQREARLALDTAMEQPEGEIFIIPARLEECQIPQSLKKYQYVDLFNERGYERLIRALKSDAAKKDATIVEAENERVEAEKTPILPEHESDTEETSNTRLRLSAGLKRLRFLLDIKYLSILIAVIVLLFGNNIYAQVTGHSIFTDPSTPTPTATATLPPTATNTPVPTDTTTPSPTFTPVPPTDTLVPTPTGVPPVPLGEDWLGGCISTLWSPYPSSVTAMERGDGCWKEPMHVFSAENGDLDFLAQRKNAPAEIYGLFAPLPERGTVTVKIRLRDLNNADLWMGVFAEPNVNSEGLLMIIPSGNVKKRVFVQKEISTYETINSTSLLAQGNGFSISFSFTTNSARSTVNPSVFVTSSVPISSSQKWLFLGYKGLSGSYRVDGTFLSFELK